MRAITIKMKHLFQPEDFEAIKKRINVLQPDAQREWGKMDVAQMLAHVTIFLNTAMGNYFPKPRVTDPEQNEAYKKALVNDQPMPKHIPSDTEYVVTDVKDFEQEKRRALEMLQTFYDNGPQKCTTHPHPAFGHLTPEEWATFLWKHYDHHLRQFGV